MERAVQQFNKDKERLESLKREAKSLEMSRVRLETELDGLNRQEEEILNACKELGFNTKEELETALLKKMDLLNGVINKLQDLMNGKEVSFDETSVDVAEVNDTQMPDIDDIDLTQIPATDDVAAADDFFSGDFEF